MRRRAMLVACGASLAAASIGAFAQPGAARGRIAFLHPGTERATRGRMQAFRSTLKTLGYVEGRDIEIEPQWADDRTDRLVEMCQGLVAKDPAVIVTASSSAIGACHKATKTIPIVFATGSSPVEQGFAASLQRPGGNITGVTYHQDLEGKIVEIVREALPSAKRLAVLVHERDAVHKLHVASIEPVARRKNFEVILVRISGAAEIERGFRELVSSRAEALLLPSQALFSTHIDQIANLAVKGRMPVFSTHSTGAAGGGLVSYGTLSEENYRRAAVLVDKILRGANPGTLPIEQPERIQLVVNAKTARAIGAKLAPALMLRADRVIE